MSQNASILFGLISTISCIYTLIIKYTVSRYCAGEDLQVN